MDEALVLGLRTDEAQEGEVTAAQDGFGDRQVQHVAVGQHQVEAAGLGAAHLGGHRLHADALDVRGTGRGGKGLFAFVDPLHAAGQPFEQVHDGAPHVAGAVELQREARRGPRPRSEEHTSELQSH